jgi:hypothetical protein
MRNLPTPAPTRFVAANVEMAVDRHGVGRDHLSCALPSASIPSRAAHPYH